MDEAIVPIGEVVSDQIVKVAEQAEKRIEAVQKIKRLALRVTNKNDWVDQNGKPYLQASGSEKVARLFGVSWRIDEPTYQEEQDGHFSYTYKGEFAIGDTKIEAIGTRSSKDPFFSVKNKVSIPTSEIDKTDVKKSAYTNLLGNGITRLLGIRNLTYEDLADVGITREEATKFQYKQRQAEGAGGSTNLVTQKQGNLLYAKCASKQIPIEKFCEAFGIKKTSELAFEKMNDALKWIEGYEEERQAGQEG